MGRQDPDDVVVGVPSHIATEDAAPGHLLGFLEVIRVSDDVHLREEFVESGLISSSDLDFIDRIRTHQPFITLISDEQ